MGDRIGRWLCRHDRHKRMGPMTETLARIVFAGRPAELAALARVAQRCRRCSVQLATPPRSSGWYRARPGDG